jgi:PAS domain S-box-containing protein
MSRRANTDGKAAKTQRHKTLKRRIAPKVARTPAPNRERYRLVIEAIAEGIYEWSTETNHLELSTRLNEMFGFEKGELTSASWLERVHSDDRNRYRDATVAYFKGLVPHLACEYRILRARSMRVGSFSLRCMTTEDFRARPLSGRHSSDYWGTLAMAKSMRS